jgi:hypothetical protein
MYTVEKILSSAVMHVRVFTMHLCTAYVRMHRYFQHLFMMSVLRFDARV